MGNIRCAKGIRLGTALLGLSLFLRPLPLQAEYAEGMEAYRKAWAAYATQSYDEAKRWAERAVRADPENAHAHALLGNLAYLRHDLAEAKGSWQKAMGLNSQLNLLQGRIAQAELELGLENQLKPAGLGALTLRLPANLTPEERAEILQNLSQAMEKLEPYFKYRPERPLTVLIYPHEQFYASTHLPTEVLGLFDGKIRVPHQSDLGPVLWHEYAHALVYDLSHGRAPRWLHEGLAQEAERMGGGTARQPPAELPPLRALLGIADRPGEAVAMPADQFYAASYQLVLYLLDLKDWSRMRAFLKGLGEGGTLEEGLRDLYGMDLATLERRWRAWTNSR